MGIDKYLRFASVLLLILTIFNISATLWEQKEKYLSQDYWERYSNLKHIYVNSQYVSKNPIGWIPDEVINAYAGGAYITGTSPILIAPDTPPLGRYFIGLSALLLHNENIIILLFGIGSLIMLYLIGSRIYISSFTTVLVVYLISSEPLFLNQFVYVPLLDIMQLFFLLLSIYFFSIGFASKRKAFSFFLLSTIFLGAFISVKFFATGITVLAAYYCVLLLHKYYKKIIIFSVSFSATLLILFLSYGRVLLDDQNIRKFIGIQKWVFLYHQSQLILPFTIWPLLIFNKWYVWYGDKPILSDPQWRISWPFVTIGAFLTILFYLLKKLPKNMFVEVLMAWTVFYILFFSIGQITARYLVIYLPILYFVTLYGAEHFMIMITKEKMYKNIVRKIKNSS